MRVLSAVATVVAVLMLAACSLFEPDSTVRALYDAVRTGDEARARTLISPEIDTPQTMVQLARLRTILPKDPPRRVKVAAHKVSKMLNAGETLEAQEIFEFKDRKALVSARLHRASAAEPWKAQGFHVRVFAPAELAVNAFAAKGKTPVHFLFLLATIAAPLSMIAALVKVVRRKGLKRKWLWGILAFLGAVTVQMNWTTGQIFVGWLSIQLIGAGMTSAAPGIAPWMLAFTLPFGAVLILTGFWANPARSKAAKVGGKRDAAAFD